MLAATSRRLTKAVAYQKRTSAGIKSRNCTTSTNSELPGLKPTTYTKEETAKLQAWLDKVNADPVKQNALNAVVEASKKKLTAKKAFWKIFAPVHGVTVPEKGVKREVLAGVIWATTQSWSEYLYALRIYQAKLQSDEAFYKLHEDLRSKDKKVVKKAKDTILAFVKSIQTNAQTAQLGVIHLLRSGMWDAIRSGEAVRHAEEYIIKFKREVKIEITTAHKLSTQELEHYKSRFHQIANDDRTKVFITTKEDPSILGGEILNINGHVYDQSWKHQQEEAIKKIAQYNSL